ncbi:MAG: 1-deoxy-D-xylulose-5-phosphate reductoisomerase, partial [Chloroflexi bacterium]|nr:1-deoxy-D-xylulose-5-phosphate reductoisomerase [Chloroflexota bacterium]
MDNPVTGRRQGLVVLGSTGSIGLQTLDVVRSLPGRFNLIGLAAGGNVTLLEEQSREFRPRLISCDREGEYLRSRVSANWAAMEEMAAHPDTDVVVVATAGATGLSPTLAALRAGKIVALANKEVLVMAGQLLTAEAKRHKAE